MISHIKCSYGEAVLTNEANINQIGALKKWKAGAEPCNLIVINQNESYSRCIYEHILLVPIVRQPLISLISDAG